MIDDSRATDQPKKLLAILICVVTFASCGFNPPEKRQCIITFHSTDGGGWIGYDTETTLRDIETGEIYRKPGEFGRIGDTVVVSVSSENRR